MTEPTEPIDAPRAAILAAAYSSTATMMGYSLVTAAAMLTFFFAFQGILLSSFPGLHKGLADLSIARWLPASKIVLGGLCALAVVFNYWSYLIVRMFIEHFERFATSGAALERACGLPTESLYSSILGGYSRHGAQAHLHLATRVFFIVLSIIWLGLAVLACMDLPSTTLD